MPHDNLIALASSIHAGPGTYALLLGSGVSVASGVPSGWSVTIDLVQQLSRLRGEGQQADPIGWYNSTTAGDPDYSRLLAELAPSAEDRRNLLARYFEPTDDEKAEGVKLPSRAHRAIAQLVAEGYVRVIVTTNFDRLLEAALAEVGVQPTVIASASQAEGATPIAHSRCTIVKVHGDYLFPNLKNTVDELERYDGGIDDLLNEVFDQYGLVVVGWSAVWDTALRAAMMRSPRRRYTLFWAARGEPQHEARVLIANRGGLLIPIADADSFFESLHDCVGALANLRDKAPATTDILVARVKRYLPNPVDRIRLADLFDDECERVITESERIAGESHSSAADYVARVEAYERACARLLRMLAVGVFFDDGTHTGTWHRVVRRLARREVKQAGQTLMLSLQHYPTLLAIYAIGLAAIAASRPRTFAQAVNGLDVPTINASVPVLLNASANRVLHPSPLNDLRTAAGEPAFKLPQSERLAAVMREAMGDFLRSEREFKEVFDNFEFLVGVAVTYDSAHGFGPVGRFVFDDWFGNVDRGELVERFVPDLLDEGMFGGDRSMYDEAREAYKSRFAEVV